MSGDLSVIQIGIDTNEFVENFKRLAMSSTIDDYSLIIDRLIGQLNQMNSDELFAYKPLTLALIEHFYRIVPILNQRLTDEHCRTNRFLGIIVKIFDGPSLFKVFLAMKDASRLEMIFRNYLPFIKDKSFIDHLENVQYDHLINCFLPIVTFSSLLVTTVEEDFSTHFLQSLLDFADVHWRSIEREKLIKNIFTLIKILCKIPSFVTMIIQSNWPKKCLNWLTTIGRRPSFEIDFYICLILQKIARHTTGVELLNELNCLRLLKQSEKQMKIDHNDEEFQLIHFTQSIIYALLVESDEIKEKTILNDKILLKVLQELISSIIESSRTQRFIFRGCHVSEMLCILSKLFVNDDIVEKCFNEHSELFDSLCRLLLHFTMIENETSTFYQTMNDGALMKLVNLLWSVSFHPSFHEKFKSNSVLMHTLANLATCASLYVSPPMKTIPNDIFPLKQAAEGILWNLKSSRSIECPRKRAEKTTSIMISYSHSDVEFCRKLVEHLSSHVSIWVDYEKLHQHVHTDDLWEDIARAMEEATTIVLILSKEYYNSKSCRQELSYAVDTLKKRIIPIYAPNQDYKASGWLGIRIAGQKYVHFGRKTFDNAFNELLASILPDQKRIQSSKLTEDNSIQQWTSKDVQQWFLHNQIHPDLINLFDNQFQTGTALLAYAQHLKQCYQIEYMQISTNYQMKFNGKSLQTVHFINFVDALWRLEEKYDPQLLCTKLLPVSSNSIATWF